MYSYRLKDRQTSLEPLKEEEDFCRFFINNEKLQIFNEFCDNIFLPPPPEVNSLQRLHYLPLNRALTSLNNTIFNAKNSSNTENND